MNSIRAALNIFLKAIVPIEETGMAPIHHDPNLRQEHARYGSACYDSIRRRWSRDLSSWL